MNIPYLLGFGNKREQIFQGNDYFYYYLSVMHN